MNVAAHQLNKGSQPTTARPQVSEQRSWPPQFLLKIAPAAASANQNRPLTSGIGDAPSAGGDEGLHPGTESEQLWPLRCVVRASAPCYSAAVEANRGRARLWRRWWLRLPVCVPATDDADG
jgi:hypothetical protein